MFLVCFFKQKTAYEMRISDWSSDVCSSDLSGDAAEIPGLGGLVSGGATVRWGLATLAVVLQLVFSRRFLELDRVLPRAAVLVREIGRASCRERVCQYV